VHTAVWVLFAGCIVAIPFATCGRRLDWAMAMSGLVWLECAVLALNRCRCPLTDVAARHTGERADNFDIYLPLWLARYNKQVFGTLFFLGEIYLLRVWAMGG
jgi:hypothetical protein